MTDKPNPRYGREIKYAVAVPTDKQPRPTKHGAKVERVEKTEREDRWR